MTLQTHPHHDLAFTTTITTSISTSSNQGRKEAERSTRHQQSEQQWPVSNDDSHKSLSQLSASEGGSNANAFTSAGSGADFALKRSRRTDYRKRKQIRNKRLRIIRHLQESTMSGIPSCYLTTRNQ